MTDYRTLVYVTRLNSGVVNYGKIFGFISLVGISLGLWGLYRLLSLFT